MELKKRLLLLSLLILATSAPAQTVQPRPKIAVALSGGGARGLAHIGVLRWFNEHRIPIDYIAGTSAGALIGAMYATGISPNEMQQMVSEVDWNTVLGGIQKYDELSFRRKQDRRAFQNDLELGIKGGLRAPAGLNAGHQVGLVFDRIALPYSTVENFDQLPVPLRVIATDLEKGEFVALKDGSLSTALRASSAVPGLFTPIEREGRVLVDGALTNNLPTDVARAMGGEIVIAVDISAPLMGRAELGSLTGVLSQAIGIMAVENERRHLQLADIVVAPNLAGMTALNYFAAPEIIEKGYQGAAQKVAVLKKFSVDEATWQQILADRDTRRRAAEFTPEFVQIETNGPEKDELQERLEELAGEPLEPERLERELDAVRGQGRFESLGYEKVQRDGETGLRIRAQRKFYGPPLINFGAEINGSDTGNIQFAGGFRLTQFDIGSYGSELRTDVRLGSRTLLATEYYRPLHGSSRRRFFVAPRAFFDVRNESLFLNGARTAEYRTRRAGLGLDAGYTFTRSEARLGVEFGNVDAAVRIGNPLLPSYSGGYSLARARYEHDGQNSAIIPTSGTRFVADTRYFFHSPGATDSFPQAEISLSHFKPISNRSSVFFSGAGGTTFGRTAPATQQFTLGGPFRVGALQLGELRGSRYLLTSAGYLHELADLPPLVGGKLYGMAFLEHGGAFESFDDGEYSTSLSAAVIAATRLGPVSVGGSLGDGGRSNLFFSLGRVF